MIEPVAPVGFQMKKELDTVAVGLDAFPAYVYKFRYDFEWDSGYSSRYGIIFVDYLTQTRTPNDSAHWFRKLIENNGLS